MHGKKSRFVIVESKAQIQSTQCEVNKHHDSHECINENLTRIDAQIKT